MRLFILLLTFSSTVYAQLIDNTASFRTFDAERFVRIHYENDFFANDDKYYSQGINAEFVHPMFEKFFLTRILIAGKEASQKGIAFEHNGFTPTSISSDSILYGDRPYATTLTARVHSISYSEKLRARITSSFSFGAIGPAAGGKAMQSTIHQWIDDDQPKGWEHQIQNDVVLNYTVGIESNLLQIPGSFLCNGIVSGQIGTLNTKLSAGIVLVGGKLSTRLSNTFTKESNMGHRKFNFHGYCQPLLNLVGYDATLQGGMFNKDSPYTISAGSVTRWTFQTNIGLVLQVDPVYLEYFFTFLTQEFNTGLPHAWGGVRVGIGW